MILRPYQAECAEAVRSSLNSGDRSICAVLPTGSGKSAVVGHLLSTWMRPNARVGVVVHTQELVGQLASTIERFGLAASVYSASLDRKELGPCNAMQIQSVFRRSAEVGPLKALIVDEADKIPGDGEGMYRTFLAGLRQSNPAMPVVGLTATPYRLKGGLIYGEGRFFDKLVYEAGIKPLIDDGYLCNLTAKDCDRPDLSDVKTTAGEYNQDQLGALMADEARVARTVANIISRTQDRNAVLIFATSVRHCQMIREAFARHGIDCPIVYGEMPDAERDDIIGLFKVGVYKYVVNVNVLSIGFDYPGIDAIAMLRPTKSPALYYQMVGRGLRIAKSKANCLILDYAGNVALHGPIDELNNRIKRQSKSKRPGVAPIKVCRECQEICHVSALECPSCHFKFPARDVAKHDEQAHDDSPISDSEAGWIKVRKSQASIHQSKSGKYLLKWIHFLEKPFAGAGSIAEWWDFQHNAYQMKLTKAAIRMYPGVTESAGIFVVGDVGINSPKKALDYLVPKLRMVTHLRAVRNGDYFNITDRKFDD